MEKTNNTKQTKMPIKPFGKRRWLFFLLMSVALCQGLKAQNTEGLRYFYLVLPDNSVVSHQLTDGINIHFQDSIIVVNGMSYYMEDIVKYYFSVHTNFTITVAASPEEGGIVSGGGDFLSEETCTVTATANPGYVFVNWTQNGTIVSTNSQYTFPVLGDMTLVANFVPDGNIVFADANVKSICVANWDTNGDGELSYVEAASVTDLGYYFEGNGEITSFDELQYFIGLSSIGDWTFYYCDELTSFVLPNTVTAIGVGAFGECYSLTSIVLPSSLTTIGDHAFYYCQGLISIVLPNSLTTIGDYAFYYCSSLIGELVIPETVTAIGNYAFKNCNNFQSITSLAITPPTIGYSTFYGFYEKPLFVPCGASEAYQYASYWNKFANIQESCSQQSITLAVGWNWFSAHLDITLDDLKAALVDALPGTTSIKITSQSNGSTTYNGTMWRGALNVMDLSQMYMVEVTADCEITLTGNPINPAEHPVTIHNGINWIAFPLSESMTLSNAFAGFALNGDMVSSQSNGSATYTNQWRGQLGILEPGKGYMYKSNIQGDRTFTFPISTK